MLDFKKKNKQNVGECSINPHVPFQRRLRVRNRLLPIDPSITNFILTKPPFQEGLSFKIDAPPKPIPKEIGSMLLISSNKNKRRIWDVERMKLEWPTWTIKSWSTITKSTPYLKNAPDKTGHSKIQSKLLDLAKPKLSIHKTRLGGEKLACLLTGSIRFNKNLIHLNLSSCSLNSDAVAIVSRG